MATRAVRKRLRAPDEGVLRAMGHPLRFQILSTLNERVASPKEIADELGEEVPVVAYHVRNLRDLGALELVDTQPRRGATEHFYRATVRPELTDAEYARLPAATRRRLVGHVVRRLTDDAARALDAGGFDGVAAHASWATFQLDDAAHAEAVAALEALQQRLVQLQDASARRAARKGAKAAARTRYELGLLLFEPGESLRTRRS